MKKLPMLLILVIATISVVQGLGQAEPTNRFYSIPYYYGARVKDWNNTLSYYEEQPAMFFWSYNWNIDFKGNLWIADKEKHSIYYISKEIENYNAIFKVTGEEYVTGYQNGNVAMGTFNEPTSLTIYDNNPSRRYQMDNLKIIKFFDKFFEAVLDEETFLLKDRCMQWAHMDNATTHCGEIIEREFSFRDQFDNETEEQYTNATAKAQLDWGRVDFRKIKLVPWVAELPGQQELGRLDPRIVYIADSANHCIRRILIKQANVDTFAGVCGLEGFSDGTFGSNLLSRPEVVGTDSNGTLFIYDSGNSYIRMVDPATKIMTTLLHGSCRIDYLTNRPQIRVPFQLELKPMVCFKQWVKLSGLPDDHIVKMPPTPEILDESAVIQGYGEEHPSDEKEEDHKDETLTEHANEVHDDDDKDKDDDDDGKDEVSDEEKQCYDVHWRDCKYIDDHPLIMDKIYYDFRQEWIDNVVEKTMSSALAAGNDQLEPIAHQEFPGGVVSKYPGNLKLKSDPRMDPKFRSDLKMCTKVYEDTSGALNSDGLPTMVTDLIFCNYIDKCCGAPDESEEEEGEFIEQIGCCNKD